MSAEEVAAGLQVNQLEEGIYQLIMDRPSRLNAVSMAQVTLLREKLSELAENRDCRVVILSGAGKAFCSGADLRSSTLAPGSEGMSEIGYVYRAQEHICELILLIHELPKPVIAAVNGPAVGAGLAMALASDIRIATPEARFGCAFILAGLSSCDVGTSYLLPRIASGGNVAELMLTGRQFDTEEAKSMGLLLDVVPQDHLLERSLQTARLIRNNNEYGVWMTKKGLHSAMDAGSLRQAMEIENRTQVLGWFTGNMSEAMTAFIEKRTPQWKKL